MFVDASALIAMLAGEPEADSLADRLEHGETRLTSAIAMWEAVAGLVRTYGLPVEHARRKVDDLVAVAGLDCVAIGQQEWATAVDAFARYGKGRHPAKLNLGDCFAYACARTNGVPLLYKGNDFSRTDLAGPG
jgi:ribonuclease VapC